MTNSQLFCKHEDLFSSLSWPLKVPMMISGTVVADIQAQYFSLAHMAIQFFRINRHIFEIRPVVLRIRNVELFWKLVLG